MSANDPDADVRDPYLSLIVARSAMTLNIRARALRALTKPLAN